MEKTMRRTMETNRKSGASDQRLVVMPQDRQRRRVPNAAGRTELFAEFVDESRRNSHTHIYAISTNRERAQERNPAQRNPSLPDAAAGRAPAAALAFAGTAFSVTGVADRPGRGARRGGLGWRITTAIKLGVGASGCMAVPKGLEPLTFGLGRQMSYLIPLQNSKICLSFVSRI